MHSPSCRIQIVGAAIAAALIAATGFASGCDRREGPPRVWREASLDDRDPIFVRRRGHLALADLEGLYLGQPHDAARSALDAYCGDDLLRRGAGLFGGDASFVGCRVDDRDHLKFVRIGFWPRFGDRVATLEIKRAGLPPDAVYEAFHQMIDEEPRQELLQDRVIQIKLQHYRMAADWDEGLEGPAHVTVGFDPEVSEEFATAGEE